MTEPFQCAECEAIAKEVFDACAELRASPRCLETSAHRETLLGILRSGEDCFDELPDNLRFRPAQPGKRMAETNTPVFYAVRKMMEHMKKTGHRVLPI